MATNYSSSIQSEFESGEQSFETTIPTDFTLSPESDEGKGTQLTLKQQLERKQLIHDLQLMKIELSHKSLIIENMKAEHMGKLDDMEEKLADVSHQKHVLQAKLETQLKLQQEESKQRLNQTKKEMETILLKQKHIEETNAKLLAKSDEIRSSFQNLELTEEQYQKLIQHPSEQLSLRDFIALKVYEVLWPLKSQNEDMKRKESYSTEEIRLLNQELKNTKQELESIGESHSDLVKKYEKCSDELTHMKAMHKDINFKSGTYDELKSSKIQLEKEVTELQRNCSDLENSNANLVKEKGELINEVQSLKQKIVLLQQDKDYLTKQKIELNLRVSDLEELLTQSSQQLEEVKQAREELYERYVSARDTYKNEYDEKLKEEINNLHLKTSSELEKLRTSQKEVHEVELKTLRESRDLTLAQKEKLDVNLKEAQKRYDELWMELKQLKSSDETKLNDIRNELKLKEMELEHARIVEAEMNKNFKNLQMETEKLHKKLEILTREVYEQQTKYYQRTVELETQLKEKSLKLEEFEKIEQDLDNIIIQAAEVGDDLEAEKMLLSCEHAGTRLNTAKRQILKSVRLAKKILSLEKLNSDLRKDIELERTKLAEISEKLKNVNALLAQTQQPYNYMINSILKKDMKITELKENLEKMTGELKALQLENNHHIEVRNQMTQDLERLLNQREEFGMIKKSLFKLRFNKMSMEDDSDDNDRDQYDIVENSDQKLPSATIFTK